MRSSLALSWPRSLWRRAVGDVRRPQGGEAAAYPSNAAAWVVVGVLFVLAILAYTDRYVLTLLVEPIRTTFGVGDLEVGLLIGGAFALVYGAMGVAMGLLADRLNRRNLIFGGILVWSLATIACGLAASYGALFGARMAVGLGEAALTPAAISLISDTFAPARRGAAVGCFLIAVPLGGGLANLIGAGVLSAVNGGVLHALVSACGAPWRAVLVVLGASGLVLALSLVFVREPPRREEGPAAASGAPNLALRDWVRLAPLLLAVAGVSLAVACVVAWGPTVFVRRFHLPTGAVGVRVGLSFSCGGTIGVFFGGVLGDWVRRRGGAKARLRLCLLGALTAAPCAAFGLASGPTLSLLALTLFVAASDMAISSGITSILDAVSNRQRGAATALTFFLNVALGAGLGPILVALVGHSAAGGGLGVSILWVTTPVFALVIALLALASRRLLAEEGAPPRRPAAAG
jgi:MFS family permease